MLINIYMYDAKHWHYEWWWFYLCSDLYIDVIKEVALTIGVGFYSVVCQKTEQWNSLHLNMMMTLTIRFLQS